MSLILEFCVLFLHIKHCCRHADPRSMQCLFKHFWNKFYIFTSPISLSWCSIFGRWFKILVILHQLSPRINNYSLLTHFLPHFVLDLHTQSVRWNGWRTTKCAGILITDDGRCDTVGKEMIDCSLIVASSILEVCLLAIERGLRQFNMLGFFLMAERDSFLHFLGERFLSASFITISWNECVKVWAFFHPGACWVVYRASRKIMSLCRSVRPIHFGSLRVWT